MTTPLGDASSRANRRTSFGDDDELQQPLNKMDRRAMLEEWRRNRGASGGRPLSAPSPETMMTATASSFSRGLSPIAASPSADDTTFGRDDHPAATAARPPPPPSSAPSSSMMMDHTSGLSALERYRLRKARQQQTATSASSAVDDSVACYHNAAAAAPSSSLSSSSSFADEDDVAAIGTAPPGHSSFTLGTPSKRGLGGGSVSSCSKARMSLTLGMGGAQRRGVKRRTTTMTPNNYHAEQQERKISRTMIPPSYSTGAAAGLDRHDVELQHQDDSEGVTAAGIINYQPSSIFSQESLESSATTNVDGMAMQSRISAMQRRIENLEREKMDLAMSKAPL